MTVRVAPTLATLSPQILTIPQARARLGDHNRLLPAQCTIASERRSGPRVAAPALSSCAAGCC
jgi:hypothetical protein